jgi:soluble lytic murein transglycosylase-like protein
VVLLLLVGIAAAAAAPVRGVLVELWSAMDRAVGAARYAEARDREVGEYVRRYGIAWRLADDIERAARAEGIDPDLAFRLVRVESAFREDAVSPAGALGLTQLMPPTAAEMQPGITRAQILERETNLRLGFRYLNTLLALYDGDVEEALHAYNRGMGTVARVRSAGGDPANGYADLVLGTRGESPVAPVPPHGFTTSPAPPIRTLDAFPAPRLPAAAPLAD